MPSKHFIACVLTVVIVISFINESHTWRRRRRRRRHCSPKHCQVSSWSSWSPCSVLKCGKSGSQWRSRSIITHPVCGGTACPQNMQETITCYGTTAVNCVYSTWSKWSVCSPSQCGDSQRSSRYIITREQCGGTPCNMTTLRKTRACKQTFCVNQGTLFNGRCSCKPGYFGSCCQCDCEYRYENKGVCLRRFLKGFTRLNTSL